MRVLAIFAFCLALVACGGDTSAPATTNEADAPTTNPASQQSAAANSESSGRVTKDLYNRSCVSCHASGAAGAPRTGDAVAWEPRLAKGMDTLLKHTKEGIKAMPPRGMCFDCTDAEFTALIEYMSKPNG